VIGYLKRAACLLAIPVTVFLLNCAHQNEPTLKSVSQVQPHVPHLTIYIDGAFTAEEAEYIAYSAHEWETKTNYIAKINVVNLSDRIGNIDTFTLSPADILLKRSLSNTVEIHFLEAMTQSKLYGFYKTGSYHSQIMLVVDRLPTKDAFISVTEHELGHALGLPHIDKKNTVMYPYYEKISSHITQSDIELFCEEYQCNASLNIDR